ncbi:MAG: hypothetical protein M3Y42_02900 [Actinomycetota bacterium]|nr:hypothetical protein [Actinomycetota bacterium]MDQ2955896.1 hypothetical protein [Actinomycetota bacterium]
MTSTNPHDPGSATAPAARVVLDRRRFLGYLAGGSTLAVASTLGLGALRGSSPAGAVTPRLSGAPSSSPSGSPTGSQPPNDTPYEVVINMSQDTVGKLTKGGFLLYGFKAVQGAKTGVPLVWFKSSNYLTQTTVDWYEQYQAYIANSQDIPNGKVTAETSLPINLGQTMTVHTDSTCTVADGGSTGAISIENDSKVEYAAGISLVNGTVATPTCAFPLYGGGMVDEIIPIEKVLFMFSTKPADTGTVVEQAYSAGILIDLTGATSRTVTFDIDNGWDWGGQTWATAVTANEQLVPLLIDPPSN